MKTTSVELINHVRMHMKRGGKPYWVRFFGIPFCLLFVLNLSAQKVQWDSTHRPEIYQSRVDLFRSFKHSKKDIVFLGNSLTFWGEWSEQLGLKHIKNRGIPGDMTFGVLDRIDEVVNGKPSKVFVLIGINDIARNVPDSVILRNYKRIIQAIKSGSPRTKIVFQTLLPTNSAFKKMTAYYNKQEQINHINQELKKMTAEEQISLLDLHAAFADAEGNLPAQLTFDGVHLTKAGYDKWATLLKKSGYL